MNCYINSSSTKGNSGFIEMANFCKTIHHKMTKIGLLDRSKVIVPLSHLEKKSMSYRAVTKE